MIRRIFFNPKKQVFFLIRKSNGGVRHYEQVSKVELEEFVTTDVCGVAVSKAPSPE